MTFSSHQHLKKPKLKILKDIAWFQKNLVYGSKVIHQVCYSARELRQLMKSPTQQWLLQRDHEEFVNYRWTWRICEWHVNKSTRDITVGCVPKLTFLQNLWWITHLVNFVCEISKTSCELILCNGCLIRFNMIHWRNCLHLHWRVK